jgi:hypothetical protein
MLQMQNVTVVKSEGDNRKREETTQQLQPTNTYQKPNLDSSGYQKGVSLDF